MGVFTTSRMEGKEEMGETDFGGFLSFLRFAHYYHGADCQQPPRDLSFLLLVYFVRFLFWFFFGSERNRRRIPPSLYITTSLSLSELKFPMS